MNNPWRESTMVARASQKKLRDKNGRVYLAFTPGRTAD